MESRSRHRKPVRQKENRHFKCHQQEKTHITTDFNCFCKVCSIHDFVLMSEVSLADSTDIVPLWPLSIQFLLWSHEES